jgi:hypothetical protein
MLAAVPLDWNLMIASLRDCHFSLQSTRCAMATESSMDTSEFCNICLRQPNPEEFVRAIFENMNRVACCDSVVRLILKSGSIAPDYLIEEVMDFETEQSTVVDAFKGTTHKQIKSFGEVEKMERQHRKIRASWKEVQAVLGQIRGYKKVR